jgi:hypothetical protein
MTFSGGLTGDSNGAFLPLTTRNGPTWTARLSGYEALTLLDDGRSLRTPGFPLIADLGCAVSRPVRAGSGRT